MTCNISERLVQYLNNHKIANRTVHERVGMSMSNVAKFKTDPDYGATISLLIRFLAAFHNEGIIEYLFSDMPETAACLYKTPDNSNLLTELDIIQFTMFMRGLFLKDADSYFNLLDIFYLLKSAASDTYHHRINTDPVSFTNVQIRRAQYSKGISFFEDDLNSLFSPDMTGYVSSYNYTNVTINYPEFEYPETFIRMLNTGEAVTWTDIASFVTKAQLKSGIGVDRLNKLIGLSSSTIIRMEMQKTKSYQLSDICKIDDYFNLNGMFLALCIRATQSSYVATQIMDDVDVILRNPDKDMNAAEKTTRNNQYTKALSSFVRLIRYIQSQNGYTGFFNSFISGYRTVLHPDDERYSVMKSYIDDFAEFFPVTSTHL